MLVDLIRALGAAVAAVALPGYFWAVFLRPAAGLAERLAYSCALSLASVPVVAVVLTRLAGSGVTWWISLAATGIVLMSGIAVTVLRGAARGQAGPVFPRLPAIRNPWAVALLAAGAVLALVVALAPGRHADWLILVTLGLMVLAGVVIGMGVPAGPPATAAPSPPGSAGLLEPDGPAEPAGPAATADAAASPGRGPRAVAAARGAALAVVLALTAVRSYEPVLRYDWPSVRGLDSFSHAVMAEQMLAHGSYRDYLIYPPGFPAMSAVISRLSGLPPLELYPVLAPALLVLTALAAYAVATRLWGRGYGIAAAALAGLVLHGAYAGLASGRYPDLVSAYFLIVMGIAALIALYQSPGWRTAALVAVLGAAPVFYHQVATLYEAVIVVLAAVTALPYLWYRRYRADARMVLWGLLAQSVLAICYGWYAYGIGWPIADNSASSQAVSIVLGSQPVPPAGELASQLTPAIVWLGVLGAVLLAMGLRSRLSPPQACAAALILLWCLAMYLGSRTSADGFPYRFERDLGAALSVTGALALGLIVKSLWQALARAGTGQLPALSPARALATSLALIIPVAAAGAETLQGVRAESGPARLLSTPVVAAGHWLQRHNSGGTIVSTFMNQGISQRSVLAMGGYSGLQYYLPRRVRHPRSLPPAGRRPLLESQEVLQHPGSCAAAAAIAREDIRYVVLYRGARGEFDLAAFRADPAGYREAFENRSVIIYAPAARP
ncbi:MAG: hypothetical protein LBI49_03855, partial [Nocardiopsaceae bacterium]|jgi:hypothetical protein|nr:hypothetical protein [Nocardiopsaceae bacterium]